jgi:aspartyl-tRNA(Asn)/glutamyl-tRNA(Gln) amidotransferase subunit C
MLSQEAVLKVAKLARIQISSQEAQEYQKQFEKILEYFKKIAAVNTDNIEPLTTPTHVGLFLREDQVLQTVSVDEIVKCAPEAKGNLFKVPPVV